jgi:hypothetical protein
VITPLDLFPDLRVVAGASGDVVRLARISPPEWILAMTTITLTGALLFPLLRAVARRIEGVRPERTDDTRDVARRLERIEQAVESIALEVERISENQRFVTQVMSKRESAALPDGRR